MKVLEVNNLKKKLGKKEIIKGISFSVKQGEVFGFLGQNGAGKTTTIRMLVGLISPDSGQISIVGHDLKKEREEALSNIGAIVENPELYVYMTGRQNLRQLSRIYGNISDEYIDEIVEMVGLKDRINDKVKKYSLGMKQRLGIAQALVAKPKILILDEPTNGLDPAGIIELRELVKKLSVETGLAVFVSSHILSEIEQLCDTVAFIDNGVIKSVESLKQDEIKVEFDTVIISTSETDKCISALKGCDLVKEIKQDGEQIILKTEINKTSDIIFLLAKSEIRIDEIYKKHQVLEDRYMELISGGIR